MTGRRVGLIEPDDGLRDELSRVLRRRGFDVALDVADPEIGIERTRHRRFDLFVVGVPLPAANELEVLHGLWASSPRALTVLHGQGSVSVDPSMPQIADAYVASWHGPRDLADAVCELQRAHRHAASFRVDNTVDAAREARAALRARARSWGCPPASAEAEVVVSELVTNALCHGTAPIELRVSLADGSLRLVVSDHGHAMPALVPVDARDVHGRGLALVEALARSWGFVGRPDGKDVWALLEEAA